MRSLAERCNRCLIAIDMWMRLVGQCQKVSVIARLDRAIQDSEMVAIEPIGHGVLDRPLSRAMTPRLWLLRRSDQYPHRQHDGAAEHDLEHRLQEWRVHVARADEGDRP